jgi:hypothetical protein
LYDAAVARIGNHLDEDLYRKRVMEAFTSLAVDLAELEQLAPRLFVVFRSKDVGETAEQLVRNLRKATLEERQRSQPTEAEAESPQLTLETWDDIAGNADLLRGRLLRAFNREIRRSWRL